MSNIFALTKVLIKNNVFAFNGRKKKGKEVSVKGNAIGFFILIAISVTCMGIPVIFLLNEILSAIDISELVLSFILPFGGITSIIFGIFSIIGVFYFSKDSEQLLPLPIKSSELLISKFLASLVSEYLILMMFILPVLLGVGIGSGASLLYYVYLGIIFLLMPIIPSVIMAIVLMLVNKVFDFSKRKDLFMYIMTALVIVFSFAYTFGLEFLMGEDESSLIGLMSGDLSGYINFSKYIFPFFNSATYSLIHYKEFIGLASIMTFIGLNILAMLALYLIGDKLYIKGLICNSGRKQEKKESIETTYQDSKNSINGELIKKEWLIIKRTPIFMLNTVISNVIFPLIFGVSFLFAFASEEESINSLLAFIDYDSCGVYLICLGILMFMTSAVTSTSSSISRDGKSAKFMKTIPVSLKKQLDAKVYFSMIVHLICLIFAEILIVLGFKAPYYYVIVVTVPMVLALYLYNYLSLIIDLKRPRLDWMEESEAVKQNFNTFLGMLVNLAFTLVFALLGAVFIVKEVNANIYLLFSVISVVLLIMCIMLNVILKKCEHKLFSKVG